MHLAIGSLCLDCTMVALTVKSLTGRVHTMTVVATDTIGDILNRLPSLAGLDNVAVESLCHGIVPRPGNGIVAVDASGKQMVPSTPIHMCTIAPAPSLTVRIRKLMDDTIDDEDLTILNEIARAARPVPLKMPTCTRTIHYFQGPELSFTAMMVLGEPKMVPIPGCGQLMGLNCVGISYERCTPGDDVPVIDLMSLMSALSSISFRRYSFTLGQTRAS